jgi:exopolysaccharide biosynthesis polyprenyl glycosylphosphotransferase
VNFEQLARQQTFRSGPQRVPASRRTLRLQLYILLVALDLVCLILCFALGSFVRFGDIGGDSWRNMAMAAVPVYLAVGLNGRAYSLEALRSPNRSAAAAAGALCLTFAVLFVFSYFLKAEQDVSRMSVAVAILASLVSIALMRKLVGEFVQKAVDGKFTTVVVIGDGSPVQAPAGSIYLDADAANLTPDTRNPEVLQRLAGELRGADRVVIACRRDIARNWAMLLKGCNVQGEILAQEYDAVGAIGVGRLSGRTTLIVSAGPLNLWQRALKRAFDLALTIPALIALAPVLILTALAIKLDSPGPCFFRQKRLGRGNELFEIYKFRSMREEESDPTGMRSTNLNDGRLTRVGRFIRATSIDELPQLLNVLLGSMSIVGPRPHALGSLAGQELFWEVDERYWHRHALKPGITGLAQVRGFRGATHRRDDLTRRLQADLEYVAGWSIWRDIGILFSTLRVIIHPRAF